MFFLFKGAAGFVLPLKVNIVYVELQEGDDFGQIDIVTSSMETNTPITKVLDNTEGLNRQFTVQALSDCELLMLSIKSLKQMSIEFFDAFQQLFAQGGIRLKRVLEQKLRAIKHSKRVT